jgi:DNA-binding NarL/FixJ family response regulator
MPSGTYTAALSQLSAAAKAQVLIMSDHPLVRDGLIRLLSQQKDLVCCGEAGTGSDTLAAVGAHKPDLVILDLHRRPANSLELIKSLKTRFPDLLILVFSNIDDRVFIESAVNTGARGYLLTEHVANEVIKAVRTILAGGVYMTGELATPLLDARTQ